MAKIVPSKVDPLPRRKTPGRLAVELFAVFGSPAAWSLQLIINYAVAADACFPNDVPLAQPAFASDRAVLIALNLAALALAAAATFVAFDLWRRSSRAIATNENTREIARGRSHFMAVCGTLGGLGFILAILFNTAAAIGVPQCSG